MQIACGQGSAPSKVEQTESSAHPREKGATELGRGAGGRGGGTDAVLYLLIAAVQARFLHSINSVLKEFMGIFLVSKAEVPGDTYKVRGKTKLYHHIGYARAALPAQVLSDGNMLVSKHLIIIL